MAPTLGKDGRPVAFCCYLCGAQFGSRSLFIHIKQCQEKWLKKEQEKPRAERRPLPEPPAELESGVLPTKAADVEGAPLLLQPKQPIANNQHTPHPH